jgi:hypothetical protein
VPTVRITPQAVYLNEGLLSEGTNCPEDGWDGREAVNDRVFSPPCFRKHSLIRSRTTGIDQKLKSIDVIAMLSYLFLLRGVPERIGSGNDSEFVAKAVQERITAVGPTNANIRPPLRAHSTNAKLRLARMIG